MRRPLPPLRLLPLLALAAFACDGSEPSPPSTTATSRTGSSPPAPAGGSRNARPDLVEEFRRDLAAARHPSDGGGRARLMLEQGDDGSARVGEPRSWTIRVEVGPLGIAEGGAIHLLVSPFWGWSPPQVTDPFSAGYTTVATDAEGVALEPRELGPQLLGARVVGRSLAAGERVTFVYGAGPAGAYADRHAGRGSRLWIAVDGDGDGVRELIADSPTVDVAPGPAEQLVATLQSTAEPGREVRLTVAALDVTGSAGCRVEGTVRLSSVPAGWDLDSIDLRPEDEGRRTVGVVPPGERVWRLVATLDVGGRELRAISNPLRVEAGVTRILWADLHGHSGLSDGTGTPQDYYAYARDVAALDVAALTDHDHFGVQFLDARPELWEQLGDAAREADEPGRFVALLAYEWTSWLYGHRHVLWFERDGVVLSSLDEETDTPTELWRALRGRDALTIAHHSAGTPVATDWSFVPDPFLEPVTEVMSVHGSSEAADCPSPVRGALRGNFVRDVLDRGVRLGFVGSGDSHDGHPGLPHLDPVYGYRPPDPTGDPVPTLGTGGLAAILAPEATPEAVLAALRARRTYATSGPRILLDVDLAGARGGGVVAIDALPSAPVLEVRIAAAGILDRVELVRSGSVAAALDARARLDVEPRFELPELVAGEYVYVRVLQANGGMGWSSPIWIEATAQAERR